MGLQMLERAAALEDLQAAVSEAAAGRGSVLAISGEAGIGKTTLLRAFLADIPRGWRVLAGACDDLLTARPLGPLRDAAAGTGGPLEDALLAARTEEVFGALVAELDRLAPAILVVEDLHWADEATLDILAYLVRRIETVPAVVVLTYRDDTAGEHPLFGLLGALAGYRVQRLPLAPLSVEAVDLLARGTEWAGSALHAVTGGNPFYVTETLAAPRSADVPETVAQSVVARVRRLGPRCRLALEQLSIVPRVVEFELAESLLGDELSSLDEAEERGVIEVRADGIAFRHELARRAVHRSVPRIRRRALHSAVTAVLIGRPEPELARIVHHALQAGDVEAVCRYAPAAGLEAAAAGSHRQALAHFEAALRYADRMAPADRAGVLDDYSWELYNAHRFAEAILASARAVQIFKTIGDAAQLSEALIRMSRHQFMQGAIVEALAAGRQAVEVLDRAGEPFRASAAMNHASLLALAGDPASATAALQRAETLAVREGRPDLVCLCRNYESIGRTDLSPAERIAVLTESIQLALDQGLHEYVARGYTNLAEMLYRYWHVGELRTCLEDGLGYTADHGFSSHAYNLQVHRALLLMRTGELAEAESLLRAIITERPDPGMLHVYSAPPLVRVRARRGGPGTLEELQAAWTRARELRLLTGLAFAGTALAEWAYLNGRPDVAAATLREWWEHADRPGAGPVTAEIVRYCQRAGVDVGRVDVPPDCPPALAAGLRGDWRRAAAEWTASGNSYEAALELAESGSVDHTLDALRLLDQLAATAAAGLVRRRLKELGLRAVPRGPMAQTRANPAGLTPRQLDVLELLSADLTNAQIARELFLSVRTVDHHVSSILTKLGVESRGNAKSAAESLGLLAVHG